MVSKGASPPHYHPILSSGSSLSHLQTPQVEGFLPWVSSNVRLAVLDFVLRFEDFSFYLDIQRNCLLPSMCVSEYVCTRVRTHKCLLCTAKHTAVSQSKPAWNLPAGNTSTLSWCFPQPLACAPAWGGL